MRLKKKYLSRGKRWIRAQHHAGFRKPWSLNQQAMNEGTGEFEYVAQEAFWFKTKEEAEKRGREIEIEDKNNYMPTILITDNMMEESGLGMVLETGKPMRLWILLEVKAELDTSSRKYRYVIFNPKMGRGMEFSLPYYDSANLAIGEGVSYLRQTYTTGRLG